MLIYGGFWHNCWNLWEDSLGLEQSNNYGLQEIFAESLRYCIPPEVLQLNFPTATYADIDMYSD